MTASRPFIFQELRTPSGILLTVFTIRLLLNRIEAPSNCTNIMSYERTDGDSGASF